MKKTISMLLALLLTLLVGGCAEEVPEQPAVTESLVWEEALPLNHGVLEYEKLTPRPWYCGSLEFSSRYRWAETEKGYYFNYGGELTLYYADKTDLWNWVPVCNKPNCAHTHHVIGCNAHCGYDEILIRDGRIYFEHEIYGVGYPLYQGEGYSSVFASRALTGEDLRKEYLPEEIRLNSGGGFHSSVLTPSWWLLSVCRMNPDGTSTGSLYRRTESEMELLLETEVNPIYGYSMGRDTVVNREWYDTFFGDDTFSIEILAEFQGKPNFSLYRFVNDQLERVNCDGYEIIGKYLSGNTLRLYRENDGYYDLDLTTQQETFLCKAQLPDATAAILQPNCIVEYNGTDMRLFDGERWRTVRIPEELQGAPMTAEALASDRIFLVHYDWRMNNIELYQILFGEDELFLEYCGQMV